MDDKDVLIQLRFESLPKIRIRSTAFHGLDADGFFRPESTLATVDLQGPLDLN